MEYLIKIVSLLTMCAIFVFGCSSKDGNADKDTLEAAIHSAILESNNGEDSKDSFCCESHIVLEQIEDDDKVVVYAMVLYHEYRLMGSGGTVFCGSHMPTVLTFTKQEDGYSLEEYWIPEDGNYYVSSIKEKFPEDIYEDAVNTQKYIKEQKEYCDKQAEEHFR